MTERSSRKRSRAATRSREDIQDEGQQGGSSAATAATAAGASAMLVATEEGSAADSVAPTANANTAARMLRKGMVILKGFLSAREQTELAAQVFRLGSEARGGFYSCNNEKTKRMRMMNLGLRTDGGKHSLEIPRQWINTAIRGDGTEEHRSCESETIGDCEPDTVVHHGFQACRLAADVDPSIPILRPDICVVNHYTASSRLGWHQGVIPAYLEVPFNYIPYDLLSSRDPGLPVVSLSLGQPAMFQYRVSWKKTAAIKSVTLESGDALIFGGRSRGIIHGVPGVGAAMVTPQAVTLGAPVLDSTVGHSTAEECLRSLNVQERGRYNLNFREL